MALCGRPRGSCPLELWDIERVGICEHCVCATNPKHLDYENMRIERFHHLSALALCLILSSVVSVGCCKPCRDEKTGESQNPQPILWENTPREKTQLTIEPDEQSTHSVPSNWTASAPPGATTTQPEQSSLQRRVKRETVFDLGGFSYELGFMSASDEPEGRILEVNFDIKNLSKQTARFPYDRFIVADINAHPATQSLGIITSWQGAHRTEFESVMRPGSRQYVRVFIRVPPDRDENNLVFVVLESTSPGARSVAVEWRN